MLKAISKKYYPSGGPVGAAPRHPPEGVGEPLHFTPVTPIKTIKYNFTLR